MTDREKLVLDMAKMLLELQPEMPIYKISMSTRAAVMFADAMLEVAEKELAEIAASVTCDVKETGDYYSGYCDGVSDAAAAIRATVKKKDD